MSKRYSSPGPDFPELIPRESPVKAKKAAPRGVAVAKKPKAKTKRRPSTPSADANGVAKSLSGLKAADPHPAVPSVDQERLMELLATIEEQGQAVDAALGRLQALLHP